MTKSNTDSMNKFVSCDLIGKFAILFVLIYTLYESVFTLYFVSKWNTLEFQCFLLMNKIGFAIYIVTGIIFLIWFYRAHRNLHALGAKNIRSSIWAVTGWFIPFFNLLEPYLITKEIYIVSNANEPDKAVNKPYYSRIKFWWLCFIASLMIDLIVIGVLIKGTNKIIAVIILIVISKLFLIISGVFIINIIRVINSSQNELKLYFNLREEQFIELIDKAESLSQTEASWSSDYIIIIHSWTSVLSILILPPIPIINLAILMVIQVNMLKMISKICDISLFHNKFKTILLVSMGSVFPLTFSNTVASILASIPMFLRISGFLAMPILAGITTYCVGKLFIQSYNERHNV